MELAVAPGLTDVLDHRQPLGVDDRARRAQLQHELAGDFGLAEAVVPELLDVESSTMTIPLVDQLLGGGVIEHRAVQADIGSSMRQWPHLPTAQDILRSNDIQMRSSGTPRPISPCPTNFIMTGGPMTTHSQRSPNAANGTSLRKAVTSPLRQPSLSWESSA